MTRKEKSELFKDAHTITRRTCGFVGDYMVAFKLALKSLYRQKKLMEFEKRFVFCVACRTCRESAFYLLKVSNFCWICWKNFLKFFWKIVAQTEKRCYSINC
jgi:hypothetical protein